MWFRTVMQGIALLFLLSLPTNALACFCGSAGPFSSVARDTDLVIRAKVLGYTSFAMEGEILETFKGKESRKRVLLWGDNGALCRPRVTDFPIGTEWIFAVEEFPSRQSEYIISICGEYWVKVEGQRVFSDKRWARSDVLDLGVFRERLKVVLR